MGKDELSKLASDFPKKPGVYLMKSKVEKVIYVGKAKNLKNRVKSYFLNSKDLSYKTKLLVSNIYSIEYILTQTEVEAFLLEASLIKKHKPKYNIRLKDDKSYPYIKFSMKDKFPRIYLSRKVKKDGSTYFGPFTKGKAVWQTIKFLNGSFQIRDCSDHFMRKRTRPCLTHQIGRCPAPCVDLITEAAYKETVKDALNFLKGKNKKVIKSLKEKMEEASNAERFEQAAKLRDAVYSIEKILERQTVVNEKTDYDQDAIHYYGDERGVTIEVLSVRAGSVLASRPFFLNQNQIQIGSEQETPREWLVSFVNQYYADNYIPEEVLLPTEIGDELFKLLSDVLKERSDKNVLVRDSHDSTASKLLDMAKENATEHFKDQVSGLEKKQKALEEIQAKLHLPHLPKRIECYDISHFQGSETVASQVVFEEGVSNTDQYRRYKLKTKGVNDYDSMKEVLERRLKHDEYDDPQLILIDGGKGQLNVIVQVLKDLGREDLPVASLAKARTQGEFTESEVESSRERFFLPGRANPVLFRESSDAYKILIQLRDEAHRFAITYHRKLREDSSLKSVLDEIPGVGEKRKQTLLTKYSSIEEIKEASIDELTKLEGFNQEIATVVLDFLSEKIHGDSISDDKDSSQEDE